MKKLTIYILGIMVTLLIGNYQAEASFDFTDVPGNYWAKKDITFLTDKGVIEGFPDGTFHPNEEITRKQAAIMMGRALGLEHVDSPNPGFQDVAESDIGYSEIAAVVEEGLFEENTYFYPNDPLTRGEMARILVVAYDLVGDSGQEFTDVPKSSPYYHFVYRLAANRITTGYSDGTFRPQESVNRAQFSTFLSRIYNSPLKYEIRKDGKSILQFNSKDKAIEYALVNEGLTVHPMSDQLNQYPDSFIGAKESNIKSGVLIYNGYELDGKYGTAERFTPEFFDPYISYRKDGKHIGTYFDTFIILGRKYPNGEFPETAANNANYEDWKWYINRTFSNNGALANLNQAVKNNPNVEKAKVYIAIPYPKNTGLLEMLDGKQAPPTLYSRYKLVDWYINEVFKKVEEANYEGLDFEGFYWLNETVISPEDEKLVALTSKLVQSSNHKFIYSPHARSTNLNNWRSYGIDSAYLQMNAFKQINDLPLSTSLLHAGLLNALTNGTGVTIEIEDSTMDIDLVFENLRNYIKLGNLYNLSSESIIMYQGTEMVYRLATYPDKEYRKMYDDLYLFLNNK
ncbi:DUF4855 domain-containing protein [Cytobacillus sp. S13-E01]|uniref:DUF4855 domain-containing protein n=1 Tax=Cytobacillus sp. S13-E01 TaxID=3031326 RepID=UPI0023D8B501|nr:DUF4855 domain-containing protein [Cytobacillus sp. S13-E01]MDF0726051.1 DUF4855 domain-containing protein [Cytobacillus sp. S13-E01]